MTTAGSARPRPRLEAARARAAEAGRKAAEREANRKGPGPVRNITDPDSRLMPVRGGGFIQGYNTQNMTSDDGLIIATELTDDATDCGWFEPMIAKARTPPPSSRRTAPPPARPGPGRQDQTAAPTAASGWSWPMPGTAPSTTSPAPARTG